MSGIPDSSLFDIVPAKEIVVAGGKRHEIIGVPFGVFLKIGTMWPAILKLLGSGGSIPLEEFKDSPQAIAEFIAAGFGLTGNQQAIEKAITLPFMEQWDLFNGILKVTLGGGVGPFAQRIATTVELMASPKEIQNSSSEQSENSPKQVKDGKSKPFNSTLKSSSTLSSTVDSLQMKSGN